MHNMTPLTPVLPLQATINLQPSDQAPLPTSQNSGGETYKEDVVIIGHTTPGSLVITDSSAKDYSFTGTAYPTDANGFFRIPSTNSAGLNNNDFLILNPFGRQLIQDLPVFWIPFAVSGSKLKKS